MNALRRVRLVSGISLVYDALLGVSLLFLQAQVVSGLGLPPPNYPVNGNLNGLFALAVGIGYLAPLQDPVAHRWYLWLMGVGLKGVGPLVFLYDFLGRGGPPSFLLFAVSDASLALLTFWALRPATTREGAS